MKSPFLALQLLLLSSIAGGSYLDAQQFLESSSGRLPVIECRAGGLSRGHGWRR